MALTVQNLRAVGTGVEPASLLPGQIAFNITDKVIYVGDGSNFKTAFDGTQTPGVPGAGWYAMPMDFSSLGDYYVANPGYWGDVPTDQQVLTWSTALNHPIWTSGGGGGGGNQVYVVTNAAVAAAPGATTSAKITAAIGVASPDEGDVTIVTGIPDDVYEGLYFFTTEWVKGAAYAYPSATEVIYDNTVTGLTPTVQGAIDDLNAGLTATTAIANTANSTANSALSIANAALPKAGGTMTGAIVAQNINVQNGYSLQFNGGVSGSVNAISDSISLTSSTTAASSSAVRSAYQLAQAAVPRSSFTASGQLLVGSGSGTFAPLAPGAEGNVLVISGGTPAWVADTPGDVTSVTGTAPITVDNNDPENPIVGILAASTSQPGAVQLYDLLTGGTNTQALTASAGSALQGQIDNLTLASNVILGGTFDCVNSQVESVTAAGGAAGLVIGSNLPFPTSAYEDIYVVVTTGGPYSPPGGGSYNAESGDWFLCGETSLGSGIYVWQYLGVGARPAYATTLAAGIIQLATDTDTQGGVSTNLAVTPSSLQSKLSNSTSLTSSTTIASSTAVKSAYDLANAALPKAGGTMTGDISLSGAGVGIVFNDASTVEAISDSVVTTSSVTAASSTAVKSAYDLANSALQRAGGTMTGAITFVAGQTFPITGIQDATTGQKGVVQVGTNIDVTAGTISVATATTALKGLVQVGSNIDVAAGTISVKSGTTSQPGLVQLNDTTSSTSTTQALTANQGYNLQQQINNLSVSNNLTFAGTIDGSTGSMITVSAEGSAQGFTIGSAMPAPAPANSEYFTVVTVPGTMTPPGGSAQAVNDGDYWLSDGTVYNYLPIGYSAPYASTTACGVVQLATNLQTQTGVNTTAVVVPSALQSKMSDSVATTSSTTIASSTAVKSAYDLANAAVPKSCYTALGALAVGTGSSAVGTLSVGTTGQFLAANTACGTGLEWCTLSLACVPCSAYTGVGAILAGTGAGTFTALPVGTNGQVLVPNSSCIAGLEWITTSALSFVGYTCTGTPFNTAFGSGAGDSITTGICNTSLGHNAGTGLTTGNCNVLIGNNAGCGMGGASCTVVIGSNAVTAAAAGFGTVAIGSNALAALTSGACNTAIGFFAGAAVNLGIGNTLLGYRAGDAIAGGSANVAIGVDAGGLINTGGNNIAIGNFSGDAITTGGNNVAIGVNSLGALSTTNNNTAVGHVSGCAVTTGSSNVLLGCGAGTGITVQDGHVAVGIQTLVGALDINNSNLVAIGTCALRSVTTGLNNIGIGFCAGTAITSGGCNIAIGAGALDSVTSTANNVGVGFSALTNITTGSENIAIGTCSGVAVTTGTDIVAIGHNAAFTQSSGAQSVHIGTCAARSANAVGVTAIGFCAGQASTTAGCITYLGWTAGRNATGLNNTYVGALTGCAASNTSACGTLLGFCAGSALTTGNGNTLLGFQAGRFVTTGGFNVALGPAALQTATTGSSNVAIGCGALAGIGTTSGNTAVGHRAGVNATGSNNVVVGCDAGNQLSTGSTNVFIGNTAGDAVTTGSNNTIIGDVAGTTGLTGEAIIAAGTTIKFQANASGAWSPDGTNYGTTGQTLQSAGTGAPPTWVTGASGTFTSQDGKTITVTNGLITSIV